MLNIDNKLSSACVILLERYRRVDLFLQTAKAEANCKHYNVSSSVYISFINKMPIISTTRNNNITPTKYLLIMDKALKKFAKESKQKRDILFYRYYSKKAYTNSQIEEKTQISTRHLNRELKKAILEFIPYIVEEALKFGFIIDTSQDNKEAI